MRGPAISSAVDAGVLVVNTASTPVRTNNQMYGCPVPGVFKAFGAATPDYTAGRDELNVNQPYPVVRPQTRDTRAVLSEARRSMRRNVDTIVLTGDY